MRRLTPFRAAAVAAFVAFVVFVPSVRNGWSGDDTLIVAQNEAVRSIGNALAAWFGTYWPPPFESAGLHRPLTIFTYSIEWVVGGGAPWLFHLTNTLLHAVVTGLVVLVLGAWLPARAALVAGLVFAIHPVHVEAVANVVGRAELLAAAGVLGALLTARRYRVASTKPQRAAWLAATVIVVGLALHAKEHAVVALPLILLDHLLDGRGGARWGLPLYAGVIAVTGGWLYLWHSIAGAHVISGAHVAIMWLPADDRITTMLPAYLDWLRLLALPLRLTSDYSPDVIPLRTSWSWLASLGLASMTAFVLLGLVSWRRAPAFAFAVLAAIVTYAPISNILFPSGVMLSERGLYLAVLVPAVAAAIVLERVYATRRWRAGVAAAGVVGLAFTAVSVERIPFWSEPLAPIAEEYTTNPQNYRIPYLLALNLSFARDTSRAMAEMMLSTALFSGDPYVHQSAATLALSQGWTGLAVAEAAKAYQIQPAHTGIQEVLVEALLRHDAPDSALAVAADAMRRAPAKQHTAAVVVHAMAGTAAPSWSMLLARARHDWLLRNPIAAQARLDSISGLPDTLSRAFDCELSRRSLPFTDALDPGMAARIRGLITRSATCGPPN